MSLRKLLLVVTLVVVAVPLMGSTVPVTFTFVGTVGGTGVYKADLTTTGLSQVASITITDNANGAGSPGIFSGFDVDAVFLDGDGSLATSGDQTYGSNFSFTAGSILPTADPAFQPNGAHPGPTFGSLNATTIDLGTATLNSFDGVSVADVNVANGFLSLGEGGVLSLTFTPSVNIGTSLFLMTGDVGNNGEGLAATVTVSDQVQTPEPASIMLLGSGLLGIAVRKLRFKKK